MLKNKRYLITGGAGFIGSCVARLLVAQGCDVLVYDKLTYAGTMSSLQSVSSNPRFRFVQSDVADGTAALDALVNFAPDVLIHLAAESHVDRSIDGPADFITTNVVGTFTLLQAALTYFRQLTGPKRAAFRFHHVSTDEVFGSLGPDGSFTEDTPYAPRSPYSATKAASDHLVRAWGETYELPVVLSNCSNNYGPFQFPEKLIPLILLNALEGKALPVYGDGCNVRDWLFVEDHAKALICIAETGRIGESYNVGGKSERSNLEVVETLCDLLDNLVPNKSIGPRRNLITFVADRPGHDRRYAIDASKIEQQLGWRPSESFESGLRATVQWYLDNLWWWEPLRTRSYDGARLGLATTSARH